VKKFYNEAKEKGISDDGIECVREYAHTRAYSVPMNKDDDDEEASKAAVTKMRIVTTTTVMTMQAPNEMNQKVSGI
jgi:hypothetical protein